VAKLEAMGPPDPSDIFDHMYKEMPWNLREQRDALLSEVGR
jgi:TPP-dependent pyruvate/acetoin dehydrogenase alpha subunit